MKIINSITNKRVCALIFTLILCGFTQGSCSHATSASPTVVVVVRHAEKAAVEDSDPPLSEQGIARSQSLVRVAEDAEVSAIYCTQFRRTRETAEPLATLTGAQVNTLQVNHDDTHSYIEQLAADILNKHRGQTTLVISHSNTVPLIVERLGGKAVPAIKDNEYDNLFIVVIPAEGAAKIIKARYGA